jgi:hypothetical protein
VWFSRNASALPLMSRARARNERSTEADGSNRV